MTHYLIDPLQFEFMRRALAAVVLTGVVSGVLGAYVVLRGMAFIGDALSHAVFPGIVIAVALGRSILLGAMVVGLLTACGIALISRNRRVSEDTAIGILFAGMFALGVVLVSSLASYQKDVADLLFGSILGVSRSDLELAAVATAVVLLAVLLLNKEFSLIAFDREMAEAMRYPVFALDLLLLALITLAIVVSLRTIGNILVLAMLVTPAATARFLTDRLVVMQALAAVIGAACGVVGLYISFWWDLASGGTIVVLATLVFFAVFAAAELTGWRRRASRSPEAPSARHQAASHPPSAGTPA
jgi:manganese/iron transport system permease protein